MGTNNLPMKAIRTQIVNALDLLIHVERMRDGVRRVTEVKEISGIEGDVVTLGNVFSFVSHGQTSDGKLRGAFESTNFKPSFFPRIEYFGLAEAFMEALTAGAIAVQN